MKRCVWCFVLGVVLWAVSIPAWATAYGYLASCGAVQALTPTGACALGGSTWIAGGTWGMCHLPSGSNCAIYQTTVCSIAWHSYKAGSLYPRVEGTQPGVWCIDSPCPTGYSSVTMSGGGTACLVNCPAGQVRDAWGNCVAPPCPTGTFDGAMSYTGTTLPATLCVGGCVYNTGGVSVGAKIDGVMKWATEGTTTGATCTEGVGSSDPVDVGQDVDKCVTDGNGRKVCPSATPDCINVDGNEVCDVSGKQCEVVNGKISCAGGEPLDPDTVVCWQENGQTVCAGSSGRTSSETQTTVNPDGTTTKTTTTTSNVKGTGTKTTTTTYDANGQVISSNTTLTGGGDPGSSGTGGGSGSQDGEVGGTGDENTDQEETFSVSGLGDGATLDLTGKDKAAAQAKITAGWDSVKAAPIVAALNVNAGSIPVGACPTLSMTLPLGIGNVSTDLHCTVWEAVKGVLSVVSLAAWAILGVIIIASA